MKLYIGNKNYSSWSLRPWLLMKQAGIDFEEVKLRLDTAPGSPFKRALEGMAPAGRVPVLVDDDGFAVWDTLAIAETLAERHPDKALWPKDAKQRARARSLSAEMHSGFGALRTHFGMNVEASLPEVGMRILAQVPQAAGDLARIDEMWRTQVEASGGPFLFGEFGIVDAFFAPIAVRFRTYAPPLSPTSAAYMARLLALPAMQAWTWEALKEADFIAGYEDYRESR